MSSFGHGLLAFTDQPLKTTEIEVLGCDSRQIARWPADQQRIWRPCLVLGFRHLSQLRHINLKTVVGGVWRLVLPDQIDKSVCGNHLIGVSKQDGEERALLSTAQG
jgi:hypothetical protein